MQLLIAKIMFCLPYINNIMKFMKTNIKFSYILFSFAYSRKYLFQEQKNGFNQNSALTELTD